MRSHRRQQSHSVPALLVARATRISQRTTNRSALPCAAMKCSSLWEKEPPPKKSAKEQRERKTLTYHDACRWRWRLRPNYSVRVLAKIKQRFDDWQPLSGKKSATPDSPLGKAVMYSLTRWGQLMHYADTGNLSIDNNSAENVRRLIAVGRKNHLFIGSESGGHNAAYYYPKHGDSPLPICLNLRVISYEYGP